MSIASFIQQVIPNVGGRLTRFCYFLLVCHWQAILASATSHGLSSLNTANHLFAFFITHCCEAPSFRFCNLRRSGKIKCNLHSGGQFAKPSARVCRKTPWQPGCAGLYSSHEYIINHGGSAPVVRWRRVLSGLTGRWRQRIRPDPVDLLDHLPCGWFPHHEKLIGLGNGLKSRH
jgi:hypothetical protein